MNVSVFKIAGWSILGILALSAVFGLFAQVSEQEVGIVTRNGKISRTLDAGLHLTIPFIEDVTKMDTQVKAFPVAELTYSKDAQTVAAEVTLNYSINRNQAEQIFREVKNNYEAVLIAPAIKEAIKVTIAGYTAQGISDNRGEIPGKMKALLEATLTQKGIFVQNVSITNIDFDDAYETAVRNKQVQEQEALAQVNITKQEEQKKQQEILKAQALSEKTRLEAQALQSSQGEKLIEKIYAEAALEAAKKWNGQLPTQMIPGSTLPFIQLGNK